MIDIDFLKTGYEWSSTDMEGLIFTMPTNLPSYYSAPVLFGIHHLQFQIGTATQLESDTNTGNTDFQDVVRFLLSSPTDAANYSGPNPMAVRLKNTLVGDENYRVFISDVISSNISEGENGQISVLKMERYNTNDPSVAYTLSPENIANESAGDVFMNSLDHTDPLASNYSFWNLAHELAHAIGGLEDISNTSEAGGPLDNMKYSLMSYNTHNGVYAHGLQLLDILAIQETYGNRNYDVRAGNTTYALGQGLGFSNATVNTDFLYTIWDGQGEFDRIDASGFVNLEAIIDLRQGEFSSIGVDFNFNRADQNVAIAYYTVIEEAIGANANDILIGNAWDNFLDGGYGDDRIFGDGLTLELDSVVSGVLGYNNDAGFRSEDPYRPWSVSNIAPSSNDSGNDWIVGGRGDDIIYGGAGEDHLWIDYTDTTNFFTDTMYGGAGNDTLHGIDFIFSGSVFHGGQEGLSFEDDGIDTLDFSTTTGTSFIFNLQDEILQSRGTNRTASIISIERVYGSAGDDIFYGGSTFNEFWTFGGDDIINMGDAGGVVYSTGDVFGNVTMNGGEGFDHFSGYLGDDQAFGEGGNDGLSGGEGYDLLRGGAGNDNIDGGEGDDTLYGDDGDDTFDNSTGTGHDYINGGNGIDTLFLASALGSIQVNLQSRDLIDNGSGGTADLWNIENVFGSVFSDTIYGNALDNKLEGYIGSDTLRGRAGNDHLLGGEGDDLLYGEDGNDYILGEDGNDHLRGGEGEDSIVGGIGNDDLYGDDGTSLGYSDSLSGQDGDDRLFGYGGADQLGGGSGADRLYGGDGNDYLGGDNGDDVLFGGNDNDQLWGGDGNDTLRGESGDDFMRGGSDNDYLYGGDGNDDMDGDEGDDVINGELGSDILDGKDGSDILRGNEGDDFVDGGSGDDKLYGNDGDDLLFGAEGIDYLYGGSGNDDIYGGSENDIIRGESGSDFLAGNDGDDRLYGGDGADILTGDYGVDRMWGEAESDMFYFGSDPELGVMDYILDFSTGAGGDLLHIADLISYESGALSDFVQLQTVGGGLHTRVKVDIDGTGTNHDWENLVQLQNSTGFSLSDLVSNGNLIA